LEVAVEEIDDVVGQAALGHAREAAQIGEEHGHLLLDALALEAELGRENVAGGQDRDDGRLTGGPELAGEPGVRRRAEPAEGAPLGVRCRRGRGRGAGTPGGAPLRRRTRRSASLAAGRVSRPRTIRTRHVEHRPRPPQTDACGSPAGRVAPRDENPIGTVTTRSPGYVMRTECQCRRYRTHTPRIARVRARSGTERPARAYG